MIERERLEEVIIRKDDEIERLKGIIQEMEDDREGMITSFQMSSSIMLERLKDLETKEMGGERPQTAMVLQNMRIQFFLTLR